MADELKPDKVKVVDRRWFTREGEPKGSSAEAPEPAAPAAPTPEPEAAQPPEADTGAAANQQPGLLDLVDFLAQQAAVLLSGQVPGRGRDPAMARFFIDLLRVVKDRTKGQLAHEESRYLDDVLYQLQTLYVAATR